MLRAIWATSRWLGVGWAVALLWLGTSGQALGGEPAPSVVVQYRLITEFTGTERSGGRIVVALTNRSTQSLRNVTLRLADGAVGRVSGPVQESIDLAAGETRRLEGEFLFDTAVVKAVQPLNWIIISTATAGFARQALVRGELMPVSDARAAVH